MDNDELKSKVEAFHMMQLPGQPMMMHMGTSHLVSELWAEVQRLREQVDSLHTDLAAERQQR